MTVMKFVGVFAALFVLDFVFARYTKSIGDLRAMPASSYAAVIVVLNGAAAVGYVHEPWLLVPAMLGAFTGTWLSVKMS